MTSLLAPHLYTETRINIEPTFPGSTLSISTEGSSLFSSRKRIKLDDDAEQDDEAYSKRYLATESSIFFRRNGRSPRSFLWRVLDDRKQLEIQSVDLVQACRSHQESVLTYTLSFSNPIRPNGIAFADPEDHDALEIFVLTTGNELFTFTLRKDLLSKSLVPVGSDFDPSSCFKSFTPSSFSFRHPYKLVAISSLELLVSLHDGGLLRLERRAGDSGSSWRETFFSEGGWGSSLRGLIPWKGHNTVRFGNIDLEASTAAAIKASPDGSHVFTVSLDHTIKAWNARTGKIGVSIDLLGEQRDSNGAPQYLMSPNAGTLLEIHQVEGSPDGDEYYLVTNSPKGHEFKFWAIRDADSQSHGIRDVQPDVKLIPPLNELMSTNVWQLVEFHVKPGVQWTNTDLWIRARSGAICKTFSLTFDLLDSLENIQDAWQNKWVAVDDGYLSIERLLSNPQLHNGIVADDPATHNAPSTDKWLQLLFYPGRFNTAMLETALYIYRKGLNLLSTSRSAEAGKPLKERLCNAIASKITVRRTNEGQPDLNRYYSDMASQWSIFFGLVRHLHEKQSAPLSLALDKETGLCWSIYAGQVAAMRLCSEVEIYRFNEQIFTTQDEGWINNSLPLADYLPNDDEDYLYVARILAAARAFRHRLSVAFNQAFGQAASMNALRDGGVKITERSTSHNGQALQDLYERCSFGAEVSDEDFGKLTDSVQDLGGLGELDNGIFAAALSKLTERAEGKTDSHALTRYGDKITIKGAQETLTLGRDALLDLLSLVVFMSQDLESDELAPDFKAKELYSTLITRLKEYNVLLWLAENVRQETAKKQKESMSDASQLSKPPVEPILTLFESIFIGDWQGMRFPDKSMAALITYWCRAWTFGPDLDTAYYGVAAHIMGNLLKHDDYQLAMEFMPFLPNNAWPIYLKGRLYLAEGEYQYAAECFKRASKGLSQNNHVKMEALDTSNLVSSTSRSYFGDGLPRYYLHVASLFEIAKLISFTADFAALALEHLESDCGTVANSSIRDLDKRKRSMHGSPAAVQVDLAMEEIRLLKVQDDREDILGRLFGASLQTGRYQQAFEALTKFGNPVLRKASLQSLLQSLLTSHSTSTLLSLDFPAEILPEVDDVLLALTRKHLAASSSNATGIPQYPAILYAWRIQQDNFRGAAEVLWEQLQRIRASSARSFAPDDTSLLDVYLTLINTLACCGEDEGWILAEKIGGLDEPTRRAGGDGAEVKKPKRRIVTLEDVRREYQAELDRRNEMVQGRFALVGGDEMDVL